MADVESNIHVNIDTSDALASLKLLQRQISAFHTQMAKSGTAASAVAANQAQNLMNSINATGKFQASMRTVTSSTESFTNALERNKLTSREYFRYTGAATKTFGRLFRSEFETLNKVARERVKDIQTQYVKMGRGANGALQAIAVRPLTLDMKNLGTQTAIAAQRQQLLNQLLRQGSTNLLNFGKNTQWAGRQLMVGFTVPLAMLGTVASKTFMKLEEQAIRFKRVYGEMFTTQAETDAMVKQIQKLATEYTKYGVAIEDTMKMAADAAAMGKMGAELVAQVVQATRLAVLGGVEQTQALETTISVTNAFGVAAEDLANKIDFLNAVENQTVVSIEDLTIAIPKAGPVVKQLGGNVEDLAFFLTAMKEGGINASEGANALKSGLASLINPSTKASKFLGELGVNIKGIVEANQGDIKATVVGFAQALDTLDPLNRARAIEQLFGKFQFSRLSTLFQNVTTQGTQAQRVLSLTKATTEELAILSQRELDKIQNTTTYKFKKSMEDLKLAIAPVGEQFLKALTPIVEFVGKILDKFNNLGDGTKKFLTILTVALAGIGPVLLMGFGLIANAVANIIKMFAGLKSMYNRTGQSSQILGEQTNYLTKEQLEASAVAASLDQVHQRLRQTFTSETSAVNMLANAYRRAIAAQIGFTGPIPGKRLPAPKKYSKGTTSVPGTGNKDSVNADLTPGEAVIPQQSAQDPANRPAIAHMVAGGRVQGLAFAPEVAATTDAKSVAINETHVGGRSEPRLISDIIKSNPNMSPDQKLKLITMEQVLISQGLPPVTTTKHSLMFNFPEWMNKAMPSLTGGVPKQQFIDEWIKGGAGKWSPSGMSAVQAQALDNAFLKSIQESKSPFINDSIVDNLYKKEIPKIISPNDPGYVKSQVLYATDYRFNMGKGLGTTPDESRKILDEAKRQGLILDYSIDERVNSKKRVVTGSSTITLPAGTYHGVQVPEGTVVNMNRLGAGTTPVISQGTKAAKKTKVAAPLSAPQLLDLEKAMEHKEKLRAVAIEASQTAFGAKKPTNFGVQETQSSGRSNFMSTIGGVFTKPDGSKVFVKPMLSELDAIAEKRGTEIARAHGLLAPRQTIKTMIDPTDIDEPDVKKKRKIIVLESPYDSRFDPNTMPKTFTEKEYIKQLVASSLRGDKDLKKGNLGGNVVTDVGAAGVFDKASGTRSYSAGLPSMEAIAMHNLKGVSGPNANNSPFWFGNATADIPQNIQSADEYERKIKDEINKTLPKLRKTIDGFKLDAGDPAKKVYEDMYKRLQAGLNADWKKVYNFHRSILVKPDEVLEDKKGNLKPIPTKPNNGKLKSDSGSIKDTRLAPASVASSVRQGPKGRIVGKANAPGSKNATVNAILGGVKGSVAKAKAAGATIGKTISQSAAASSRTTLYGTGSIDADAKSLRRQMEKRQRAEAKTQAKMAASRTKLYGMGPMDADAKSMRRQMERRTKLANSVAYQKRIISERAAAQFTPAPSVSGTPMGPLMKNGKFETTQLQRKKNNFYNKKAAGKGGMGIAGGVGMAAGAAMIGSMAPGKVGEISQKLMMPLMGLSMIIPMLKSPASALAVGLLATVGSFAALRMSFDKAADQVLEEGEKFKGSTSALQTIAKFGGKATASEQMDLRRKNSFAMLGPATGKTTYGEAYAQTAEGKALTARISKQNAEGKGNVAVKDLGGQLSAAIMSGAMDMSQAKSLAMNAARQAGDISIGIKVIAQLESLLGPNGENLVNDPLNVRINMVNANAKNMKTSADNVKNAGVLQQLAGQKVTQGLGIGASALGGAAAGAGIGTALGPAGTLAGAIIGAGIGTAVGAIGGYFASKKYAKEAAVLGATYAVDAKIAMEQNKQMLDSLDMYYEKKVEELRLQGKINEAEALQNKYLGVKGKLGAKNIIGERDQLTAAQAKVQASIVSQYNSAGGMQESMMSGMKKATTAKYKNDPNQLAYVDVVNQQSKNLRKSGAIDSGQEFLIQAKMASGDIPPAVFRTLLQMATDNKDIAPKMMNIITKFTGATSESIGVAAQNILNAKGDINKTVQTKFITKVEAFEKDSDALDFTKNMIKLNNLNTVIPSDFMVSFYVDPKNKTAYEELNRVLDAIETQKPKTIDAVYNIMPQLKGTANFDEAYFKTLTDDQKLVYTTTIASIINIPEPQIEASEDYKAWLKEPAPHGGAGVSGSISYKIQKYREAQGYKAVTDNTQVGVTAPTGTTPAGDGNKVQSSPLDDLVKKLRDVRMNQIKVTEGWGASRKALDKLFGGNKTIDVFSGIENDLRGLGTSQDFIELIVGMDPKVYEQKKNSLFKFDNKKNIVGLKEDAKNIQEALNSITMGDWKSSMEADFKAIENQSTAFNKLANLGVPVAEAYQLISDKTLAAAIANGVNDKSLKTLINNYKLLTAAQEKSAAVSGVKTDVAQFKKNTMQEARLRSKYSVEDAFAISSDQNLQSMETVIASAQAKINRLIANGATTPEIIKAQAELNDLVYQFNERLTQLKSTVEFMQGLFDKGFSNAMQAFDVQETALNIQFKIDTKSKDTVIKEAQNEIAAIQYLVDDKEAALKGIEDQEQKINDKYDERIKALDEVEKANASISNQQKGQLTLAEALTSGDIAAAARAAQDMRAQAAADAVTKQKDAIEKSREYELSRVTQGGKTRLQLEKEIKDLQDKIFKIEEEKLEPAQEFIRLRQIQLDKDIEGLTVLGKTKDAWEAIKNQVDLALIKSAAFVDSMKLALETQAKLIAAYQAQPGNTSSNSGTTATQGPGPFVPDPKASTEENKKAEDINKAALEKAADYAPAIAAAAFHPSANAAMENGIIGALSIASQIKAAAIAAAEAISVQNQASNLSRFKAKEAADLAAEQAAINAKGRVGRMNGGIIPKMFSLGGFAKGTDTVPAMLTPGEFIMSKYAVDTYGVDTMRKINNGESVGGAVYNNTYTLTVNAKTNANPNEIAQAVMSTIKQVDDRRIRGVSLNARN